MNKQNRNGLIGTENILTVARRERRWGRMGQKGEGIKYKLVVTELSQRCKLQRRDIVNNMGPVGYLEYRGDHSIKYMVV